MQSLPSLPTATDSLYHGTWDYDGVPTQMPVQPPQAPSAFANYLTSVLPSQYSAYSALDSPCPQQPFVAAFGDIRTSFNECIFYLASPPISRIACMCTSFYQDMLDVVTASWPAQCGSGDLATLAMAKGTNAVADVCRWQSSGAATVPVTLPLDELYGTVPTTATATGYTGVSSGAYDMITPGPLAASSFSGVSRTTTQSYSPPVDANGREFSRGFESNELGGDAFLGLVIAGGIVGLLVIAGIVLVIVRRVRRKAGAQSPPAEEAQNEEKFDEAEPLPPYTGLRPPSYQGR